MIDIKKEVEKLTPEMIAIRNEIHENPELGLKEYKTCKLLEDFVKENVFYDSLKRVGETGLWIVIRGTKPGPEKTVVFRGDIDALPIQEWDGANPRSKVPGVMHACGHDVHGTINIGAAAVLSRMKDQFSGNVYFFIQQAEEILKGAKIFLNDPDIDWANIDDVVELHCSPDIDAGKIGVRYGAVLASTDEFRITVHGLGGHGAHPHTVKDPILAGAAIVMALQSIVSRETSSLHSVVVSVTTFHGGETGNVIPDEVTLTGTVRTLDPEDRIQAEESLKRIVDSVAKTYRCESGVEYIHGVPVFINDAPWVDRVIRVGKDILGENSVEMLPAPSMGGEDFAFIKEKKVIRQK